MNLKESYEYLKQFNNKHWNKKELGLKFMKKKFKEGSLFEISKNNNTISLITNNTSVVKLTVTEDSISYSYESNTEFGGFNISYKNCLPLSDKEIDKLKKEEDFLYVNITNVIHGDNFVESNLSREIDEEEVYKIADNYSRYIIEETDRYSPA